MPGISYQQAYALAFGAYMSPSGNKSFSIAGSIGLPTNKNRLSGLLSNTPIDLVTIPAEIFDSPFNPGILSFTAATSSTEVNEVVNEVVNEQVALSPNQEDGGSHRVYSSSKCLLIWDTDSLSGALPLNTDTVYISSYGETVSPDVLPASSNISVTSVEGPHNIAKLAKTGAGTIQIEIQRLYDDDSIFFSSSTFGSNPAGSGLKISISNATGTGSGFNTGAQEFILKTTASYPVSGLSTWSGSNLYIVGELVKYLELYYICVQNTTEAQELPTNEDYFEPYTETDFTETSGASISFLDQSVNGINVFRINIPLNLYRAQVLASTGRYIPNTNTISSWISLANNTTLIDEVTGGGTAGNQCGTLTIKPKNNNYSKGSAWLLKLSQAAPLDNTINVSEIPNATFLAGLSSSFIFSIGSAGGTVVPVLSYKYGGDINGSGFLTQTEKNYHNTGVKIVSKLKK